MPKFIAYFTHDDIVGSFLEGLGSHTSIDPYPASAVWIEFFKDATKNNQMFVRTYFKQDQINGATVEVKIDG